MRTLATRGGAVLLGALAAGLLAAPAAAHVTVSAPSATQGGYARLTFRVPNEKDTASTTQVEVNLPADQPITSVSTKPVPGWTATAERTRLDTPVKHGDREVTETVTKITWRADGPDTAIKPGQFQEFDVSAGPLPEVDRLVFKALQTYSDGDVVRWIEEPATDGAEPEHPAPTLPLTPAATTDDHAPAGTGESTARTAAGSHDGRADLALGLAVAGLVVALAAAGLTLVRRRPAA